MTKNRSANGHKEKIPLEVILEKQINNDEHIEASFEHLFQVGDQNYSTLIQDNHVFILKVTRSEDGKLKLHNITDENEFSSVQEVYNDLFKK